MGAFFFALFGIIWLCIVYAREDKGKRVYQARVDDQKSRSDKWFARVNKGPLNNYDFHEKLRNDFEFRSKLFDECNSIISSLPEMNGIRFGNPLDYKTSRVMEMMYDAKTGDISIMWQRGYINLYELTDGFSRKPPTEGCQALIEWYQNELRKHGYSDATILPIYRSGFVIGWRFTDGATSYETIKHQLYIN